jgi:hypothetical protein
MLTMFDLHELLQSSPDSTAQLDVHAPNTWRADARDLCNQPLRPVVTAQYILFDECAYSGRTELHVRDVKEQDMRILPDDADITSDAGASRALEFLVGWTEAVLTVLSESTDIEWLMPFDFSCADVWNLKTPQTAAEFKARCLVRSRLGRYLPR